MARLEWGGSYLGGSPLWRISGRRKPRGGPGARWQEDGGMLQDTRVKAAGRLETGVPLGSAPRSEGGSGCGRPRMTL